MKLNNMETIIPVAIVIGLTEVVKRLGLTKRLLPLFGVILGVGVSMLMSGVNTPAILTGLVIGLTSLGLYAGTKTSIQG